MKGLLKKEIYVISSQMKGFVMSLLFSGGIIFLSMRDVSALSIVLMMWTVISSNLIMSSIYFDTISNFDKKAITLPITRKNIIRSKYIVTLIFILFGLSFGSIFYLLGSMLLKTFDIKLWLVSLSSAFSMGILISGLTIPITYKFGADKMQTISILTYGLFTLCFFLSIYLINKFKLNINIDKFFINLIKILPLIMTLYYYLSSKITEKIFQNTEF